MVWQKARDVCYDLHDATRTFPEDERYGMVAQIRRSAVSVPTNIAEGHGRSSKPDFVRFLYISLGSVRELETLVEMSGHFGYLENSDALLERLQEVAKMLTALIKSQSPES
ncbi:MAG: four helix bundle protein [Armatimonadetes bacterium]|nr:four helix bundle protein [Armatimonadota bacterium]